MDDVGLGPDGALVADTDLVIDYLRNRRPGADLVDGWMREQRLLLTALTAFELRVGTDFHERGDTIGMLLAFRTLALDVPGALQAGKTHVRLRAAGRDVGIKDCLQAGICLRYDLPLATRNVAHFERVPGLRLIRVS